MDVRAVAYVRYSTARQDARSLEDQRARCAAFAAARGWTMGATFEDAEISGTQLQRPGLDRLRAEAAKRRFDVVVVDDLSRLSRDLGAGWSLIFNEFDGCGVIVADTMTGMISTDPAARMTFATIGLVSMMGVEATKHQTKRGLESRARAGFHAGGPCYGFRTVDEATPADPTRPRKTLVIDAAEAEVIREIFTSYAAGASCRVIAAALNARAVPAPRTGSKKWAGWHATTTRYVLKNRRYLGELSWNARRFIKDPATGRRRAVARPPAEHVITNQPELAIVDAALFARAQARFRGSRGGRPEGTMLKHPPSPLRGLAKCGVCGGGMFVQTRGPGRTMIRCSTNSNRGKDACTNGKSVAAERIVRFVEAELLGATTIDDSFVDDVLARFAARRGGDTSVLKADVEAAKARTKNLLDAIATLGPQPEILQRYQQDKAEVERLTRDLAQAEATRRVPDRDAVMRAVASIRAQLPAGPGEAAELQARFSRVDLSPSGSGWEVRAYLRGSRLENSSGGVIQPLPDFELVGFLRAA